MSDPALFPCLGIEALGLCAYDPAKPTPVYFNAGNAVAALALITAIQQIIKPSFVFRVECTPVKVSYLIGLAFIGLGCAFISMLLPNLPLTNRGFLAYPIVWEYLGAISVASAYAVLAWVNLFPVRITERNIFRVARAAIKALSIADDEDRVKLAGHLLRPQNMVTLIRMPRIFEHARRHSANLRFDQMDEAERLQGIVGEVEISPFYKFAYRRQLEIGRYAGALLLTMSDPKFCAILVRRCAWLTAHCLSELDRHQCHVEQANSFVQEVARQALIDDDSIMIRELSYDGFGASRMLLDNVFGRWFILVNYSPMQRFGLSSKAPLTSSFVERLGAASDQMLDVAISNKSYFDGRCLQGLRGTYQSLFYQVGSRDREKLDPDLQVQIHMGVASLIDKLNEALDQLDERRQTSLYLNARKDHRTGLVNVVASIAVESLLAIANGFTDVGDPWWFHAVQIWSKLFPPHGEQPLGMNPLQQHVAVELIDKLRINMTGFYPAISRILIAVVRPYHGEGPEPQHGTAHAIIKDAIYLELKKLRTLSEMASAKLDSFLPANVRYDRETDTLIHTYTSGGTASTILSQLDIADVDLTSEAVRRQPSPNPDVSAT